MINKLCLRRDVEGSGPRMVRGNISAFVGATENNERRLSGFEVITSWIRNRSTTPSSAYLSQKVESSKATASGNWNY
jgi:hypothetical protein